MQVSRKHRSELEKMSLGDKVAFYSPIMEDSGFLPYRKLTAIGSVADEEVTAVETDDVSEPYKRNIEFSKSKETPVEPLLKQLSFVNNIKYWGMAFRHGLFEITEKDFELIEKAMK